MALQKAGTFRDINGNFNQFAGRIKVLDAVARGFSTLDVSVQQDVLAGECAAVVQVAVASSHHRGALALSAPSALR